MDKNNNKKLKQYKKKYFTGGRVDMSKGGRVKAAVGFPNKKPQEIKPMRPTKKKPIVRKPIEPTPKKPVQPGIPVTGGGDLGSGQVPKSTLPPGTTGGSPRLPSVKIDPTLPSRGRGISIGGVGGGTGTIRPGGTIRPAPVGGPVELPKDELPIQEKQFIKGRPGKGSGRPGEEPKFIARDDRPRDNRRSLYETMQSGEFGNVTADDFKPTATTN